MEVKPPRSRALVIHPELKQAKDKSDGRLIQDRLDEAAGLALAIDLEVIDKKAVMLNATRPSTLIGSGKVEEIAVIVEAEEVELVIMDAELTPVQQRNLEKAWNCKVIDRTALILEIFSARARTREGRLQVELAQLSYQKSRLVRSWTHLERQRGGFGFMGGPGETQIEADRRLIGDRIIKLKRQLQTVVKTRELHRKVRRDVPYPQVALVGYTNAGKSTLFNRLTGAQVMAEDLLFATLDPTLRAIKLPSGISIILSDTVGFISELPTELIAAFRATLEEVVEADLLLHVRDISHPDTDYQKRDVEDVLKGLLGDEEDSQYPIVEIWNKSDTLSDEMREALKTRAPNENAIVLSALTGEGVDSLIAMLDARLQGELFQKIKARIPVTAGKEIAWIYSHGKVMSCTEEEGGMHLIYEVNMSPKDAAVLKSQFTAVEVLD